MAAAEPVRNTVIVDSEATGGATFDPRDALGGAVDGAEEGITEHLLNPHNVAATRSAGLSRVSYRLRTELGVGVWHWNPVGTWSDAAHQQGYWTSSDALDKPIDVSFGYLLPRRGDTEDNANNDDYSRLTDGSLDTFWKSNPYLDPAWLKDGMAHDQWLVVRLDRKAPVDAVRIHWGTPFAVRYVVQYWTGADEKTPGAKWIDFARGHIDHGAGGDVLLKLGAAPIATRFVRVLLLEGSGTAPAGSTDWRDRAGFAVREIEVGRIGPNGKLHDLLRHGADHDLQSWTHVSSTDPWHRASDIDKDTEQPGLDRMFSSGIAGDRPMMIPVGTLYDTPENAAAEIRYLTRRGYRLDQAELGEEPDGQYGNPEDYGALYLKWVDAMRPINPALSFGGTSAQDPTTDLWMRPDPDHSWNSHFIRYLKDRGRLSDLGFYSFEHYPFDNICGAIPPKLVAHDELLRDVMERLKNEGVPRNIPWVITEYGFSAFAGRAMAQMPSALLMANIVGQFLQDGGSAAYMYGYGPDGVINELNPCAGFGNMMLHYSGEDGMAATPMPSFHAARMITRDWLQPQGPHRFLPLKLAHNPGGWLRGFAVKRPDGTMALLLLNRNPAAPATLDLKTRDAAGHLAPLTGNWRVVRYGDAQYRWIDKGPQSYPARSDPPVVTKAGPGPLHFTIPAMSMVVVAP